MQLLYAGRIVSVAGLRVAWFIQTFWARAFAEWGLITFCVPIINPTAILTDKFELCIHVAGFDLYLS